MGLEIKSIGSSQSIFNYLDYEFVEKNSDYPKHYFRTTRDGQEKFENWFEYKLNTNNYNTYYTIAFRFNEFKIIEKSFGIEIKIIFMLNEYDYRIGYYYSQYNELQDINPIFYAMFHTFLIKNGYHQNITQVQIEKIAKKISKEFLEIIKNNYNNQNYFEKDINQAILKEAWNHFINYSEGLSEDTKAFFENFTPYFKGGKFLTFEIPDLDYSYYFLNHSESILKFFKHTLKLNKNLILDLKEHEDLPF